MAGQTEPELGGFIGGYYFLSNGTFSNAPSEGQAEIWRKYGLFQYDIMFGKKHVYSSMYE